MMRRTLTWRCFALCEMSSKADFLDALGNALGGALCTDSDLKSAMAQAWAKECAAVGVSRRLILPVAPTDCDDKLRADEFHNTRRFEAYSTVRKLVRKKKK